MPLSGGHGAGFFHDRRISGRSEKRPGVFKCRIIGGRDIGRIGHLVANRWHARAKQEAELAAHGVMSVRRFVPGLFEGNALRHVSRIRIGSGVGEERPVPSRVKGCRLDARPLEA